mmetsp:Transcript_148974/g.271112  ORF Transcript_148974/g.271112 Transcript_148974/m.271112 type:complete len:359 (+) Transcript_148974:106-1182(+)
MYLSASFPSLSLVSLSEPAFPEAAGFCWEDFAGDEPFRSLSSSLSSSSIPRLRVLAASLAMPVNGAGFLANTSSSLSSSTVLPADFKNKDGRPFFAAGDIFGNGGSSSSSLSSSVTPDALARDINLSDPGAAAWPFRRAGRMSSSLSSPLFSNSRPTLSVLTAAVASALDSPLVSSSSSRITISSSIESSLPAPASAAAFPKQSSRSSTPCRSAVSLSVMLRRLARPSSSLVPGCFRRGAGGGGGLVCGMLATDWPAPSLLSGGLASSTSCVSGGMGPSGAAAPSKASTRVSQSSNGRMLQLARSGLPLKSKMALQKLTLAFSRASSNCLVKPGYSAVKGAMLKPSDNSIPGSEALYT